MQKETEVSVEQELKKKFFDERGHVRNRERFIKPLEDLYGDKIDLNEFVSDAVMMVSLGFADYLKLEFFEDLVSVSGKPIPNNTTELVKTVDYCLKKEKEIVKSGKGSQVRALHAEVLNNFSYGAKLCACMESGIIGIDQALQMLKRAESRIPRKAFDSYL